MAREDRLQTIVSKKCERCGKTYVGTSVVDPRCPRRLNCGHGYCFGCACYRAEVFGDGEYAGDDGGTGRVFEDCAVVGLESCRSVCVGGYEVGEMA